ncbi:hypothetical protein AMJ57_05295 [Parcubacteria bacterium SG8_24]|nr:MAG: hypothetical protein AMJ57_05295 [Parcubacteria bacterium SG8_24]
MNLFKLIALVLGKEIKDLSGETYDWSHERLHHGLRVLYLACGFPVAALVIGIIVGAIGEHLANPAVVHAGRLTIAFGCLISVVLFALFWVKAVVLTHLVAFVSMGAGAVWDRIPQLELDRANQFLRWMRGITAWAAMVCLYAMVIPVWRNVYAFVVAVTCLMIFAAILSSRWFDGIWARRIAAGLVLVIFVGATFVMLSPGLSATIQATLDEGFGSADSWSERRQMIAGVTREQDSRAHELDVKLLDQLLKRQNKIRERAVELCQGKFCSLAEQLEFKENEEKISRLRAGNYWNPPESDKDRPGASGQAQRGQTKGKRGRSGTAHLPPPPVVQDERPVRSRGSKATGGSSSLDEVYQELDKYSDL